MRAGYPALEDGYAYLDRGRPGAQGADKVIKAIAEAYRVGIGNAGGCFPRQPSAHRGCVVGHCQPGPARSRRVPRRRQSMPEAATLAWSRQGRLASAARAAWSGPARCTTTTIPMGNRLPEETAELADSRKPREIRPDDHASHRCT